MICREARPFARIDLDGSCGLRRHLQQSTLALTSTRLPHSPAIEAFEATLSLSRHVETTARESSFRTLVKVRTSQVNGCAWRRCLAARGAIQRARGARRRWPALDVRNSDGDEHRNQSTARLFGILRRSGRLSPRRGRTGCLVRRPLSPEFRTSGRPMNTCLVALGAAAQALP
jgi:AhpD family alkylhydroperoxidase